MKTTDYDVILKLELDKLRELIRLKELNEDLYEINTAILGRLLKYLKKNHDELNTETIALLGRGNQIMRNIRENSIN